MEHKIVQKDINTLVFAEYNPRQLTKEQHQNLSESIQRFGLVDPILINKHEDRKDIIIGGHQRVRVAKDLKIEQVPCIELSLTYEKERELNVRLNKNTGEWDMDSLANFFEMDELLEWGFIESEIILDIPDDPIVEPNKKLSERFLVPPFSVLDTKLGFWKKRKVIWNELGIQSELGRDAKYSDYGEWIISKGWTDPNLSKNEKGESINFKGQDTKMTISIFDPVLCELMYRWFCPLKGKIIDPFAGGSVRGIVASVLGYDYTGIELNPEQIKSNRDQANHICQNNIPKWIVGDSNQILETIDDSYDFVFSCPPYFDLEKYTDEPEDLSVMSDEDFLEAYQSIINKSVSKLKDNRFACFVVGEVRGKDGNYKNLISNTIQCFENAGCGFYNDIILLRPIANAAMRVPKQFSNNRKVVRIHQNILVFYKGKDQQEIKNLTFY